MWTHLSTPSSPLCVSITLSHYFAPHRKKYGSHNSYDCYRGPVTLSYSLPDAVVCLGKTVSLLFIPFSWPLNMYPVHVAKTQTSPLLHFTYRFNLIVKQQPCSLDELNITRYIFNSSRLPGAVLNKIYLAHVQSGHMLPVTCRKGREGITITFFLNFCSFFSLFHPPVPGIGLYIVCQLLG